MKLLCLDSNSIINRAFYGVKILTTKDGTYTNAVVGFLNILLKLLADVQPDAVVCAFDLKAPTFRHKMFDGYKAQRKGMPEELAQQLPLVKQLLESMGYPIITREGYEADDILGTLSALCEQSGDSCFIATGDRDSLQLIGKNTEDCMRSGIVYGTAGMLDGVIDRIREVLPQGETPTIVATGSNAPVIVRYCRNKVLYDKYLLMEGLWDIYQKNH